MRCIQMHGYPCSKTLFFRAITQEGLHLWVVCPQSIDSQGNQRLGRWMTDPGYLLFPNGAQIYFCPCTHPHGSHLGKNISRENFFLFLFLVAEDWDQGFTCAEHMTLSPSYMPWLSGLFCWCEYPGKFLDPFGSKIAKQRAKLESWPEYSFA